MKRIVLIMTILILFIISCTNNISNLPFEKGIWRSIRENHNGQTVYNLIGNNIYCFKIEVADTSKLSDLISKHTSCLEPINNVDYESFEVHINNDVESFGQCHYARDKNHVYYPVNNGIIYETEDWSILEFESVQILPDADPKTFRYIGKGYAVDKNNMYYKGKKTEWSDSIIDVCLRYETYGMPWL